MERTVRAASSSEASGDVVRVGKRGFLAADGPHAHALVDAEGAGLDDALFQAPALGAGVLEVQVGFVDLVGLISPARACRWDSFRPKG
jgi:hypothetical protein